MPPQDMRQRKKRPSKVKRGPVGHKPLAKTLSHRSLSSRFGIDLCSCLAIVSDVTYSSLAQGLAFGLFCGPGQRLCKASNGQKIGICVDPERQFGLYAVHSFFFSPLAIVPGPLLCENIGIANLFPRYQGGRRVWVWQCHQIYGMRLHPCQATLPKSARRHNSPHRDLSRKQRPCGSRRSCLLVTTGFPRCLWH